MPLTPADVRNMQFSTTRLRPGYDEAEVDAFLDEVEAELSRLIDENQDLRSKLAEFLRGDRPAAQVPVAAMSAPEPEMSDMLGAPVQMQDRRPEPAGMAPSGHSMESVARVLTLAQQTADQAVADARREAGETLGQARREASDILGKARQQAEQITGDARARSEGLERDAQERRRQALGSLMHEREELERKVDGLRAFEREYRGRLTAYLESQLRDLDAGIATNGNGNFQGMAAPQSRGIPGAIPHELGAGSI